MSRSAIVAFLPASFAAVHLPIKRPASQLSVAKVMSTMSAGSGGVSRAITNRPASRALVIAELTSVDTGTIKIPACFAEIAFSIAEI
ncbi:unannotated protein [freshwater metagenome]